MEQDKPQCPVIDSGGPLSHQTNEDKHAHGQPHRQQGWKQIPMLQAALSHHQAATYGEKTQKSAGVIESGPFEEPFFECAIPPHSHLSDSTKSLLKRDCEQFRFCILPTSAGQIGITHLLARGPQAKPSADRIAGGATLCWASLRELLQIDVWMRVMSIWWNCGQPVACGVSTKAGPGLFNRARTGRHPAHRAHRSSNRVGHERNCWPVGPENFVGARFPARWAGLGEWLALWAGYRRPVRGGPEVLGPSPSSARGASQIVGPNGRGLVWGWADPWLFSAHRCGCFRTIAQRSGHGGPRSRHLVTGPRRTVCSEGRPADGGPNRSWLVLCPSVRVFSDECPLERTRRSALPHRWIFWPEWLLMQRAGAVARCPLARAAGHPMRAHRRVGFPPSTRVKRRGWIIERRAVQGFDSDVLVNRRACGWNFTPPIRQSGRPLRERGRFPGAHPVAAAVARGRTASA